MNDDTTQNSQNLGNVASSQTPLNNGRTGFSPSQNTSTILESKIPPSPAASVPSFPSSTLPPSPSSPPSFGDPVNQTPPANQSANPFVKETSFSAPVQPQSVFPSAPAAPSFSSQNLSSTPPPSPTFPTVEKKEHSGGGKGVFILIPIILILLGVLGYLVYGYLSSSMSVDNSPVLPTQTPITPTPTLTYEEQAGQEIDVMQDVSASDEVSELEKDINATDFSTIDQDATSISQ